MSIENEELLSKIHNIEEQIKQIKKLQENGGNPIFIELLGTPKSGKTTIKNHLITLFEKNGINYSARRETAEYNPMVKTDDGYNIWMVLELFKNVVEDLSNKDAKVIIYDRGILDRIPWMKYDLEEGVIQQEDMDYIIKIYQLGVLRNYKPISKVYITSPEISIKRKGHPGKFVNMESINNYNKLLKMAITTIESKSSHMDITYTDQYQGNIEGFVIDTSHSIINQIHKQLQEREKNKQDKSTCR